MKIALLGYGKMGQAIEKAAVNKGYTIALIVDNTSDFDLGNCDVAIDFSVPSAAVFNITKCLEAGVPVVSGTTGWLADYQKMTDLCQEKKGALLYASNFSVGVNIFFALNQCLSQLMEKAPAYKVGIEEIHHTQKLDAPSGTAITLAEGIINNTSFEGWKLENDGHNSYALAQSKTLPITALREGDVPGTHAITYTNEIDTITIKHEAHGRAGFVEGALLAAKWIADKKGVFTMQDVLNIS